MNRSPLFFMVMVMVIVMVMEMDVQLFLEHMGSEKMCAILLEVLRNIA